MSIDSKKTYSEIIKAINEYKANKSDIKVAKTFNLNKSIVDKINEIARLNDISSSEALNEILRVLLFDLE